MPKYRVDCVLKKFGAVESYRDCNNGQLIADGSLQIHSLSFLSGAVSRPETIVIIFNGLEDTYFGQTGFVVLFPIQSQCQCHLFSNPTQPEIA